MKMKKIIAFTLTEVLLTMSIVGFVAAMTIPTLNYNRVKKERTVRLKSFYGKMINAVELMNLNDKPFRNMVLPQNVNDAFDWYMENIDPYMGHKALNKGNKKVYYVDGSSLSIVWVGGCIDVVYDANGDKHPNSVGRDMFRFLYCFNDKARRDYFGDKNAFFGSYGYGLQGSNLTRSSLVNKCKSSAHYCSRLLQLDNWEFKSDYPYSP